MGIIELEMGEVNRLIDMRGPFSAFGCDLWKSLIFPCAFARFVVGSQVPSSRGYPFQWIKYSSRPLLFRESTTSSTSYSGTWSMISGGGGSGFCCEGLVGALNGDNKNSLKTGCMGLHDFGNFNSYAPAPTFFFISNGPYLLSSSFFIGLSVRILVASNQTLSPFEYCFDGPLFRS